MLSWRHKRRTLPSSIFVKIWVSVAAVTTRGNSAPHARMREASGHGGLLETQTPLWFTALNRRTTRRRVRDWATAHSADYASGKPAGDPAEKLCAADDELQTRRADESASADGF